TGLCRRRSCRLWHTSCLRFGEQHPPQHFAHPNALCSTPDRHRGLELSLIPATVQSLRHCDRRDPGRIDSSRRSFTWRHAVVPGHRILGTPPYLVYYRLLRATTHDKRRIRFRTRPSRPIPITRRCRHSAPPRCSTIPCPRIPLLPHVERRSDKA